MEEPILTGKRKRKCRITFEVPHKTIYSDIVSMPDPMLLGSTIHYHNYSDVTLYMQITGSASSPWSGSTVNLGSLASGSNTYANLDNFMSRTKPAAATVESVMFTLKGYSDSGYTTLLYTFNRDITVIFLKSDDGSWTTDFLDNFDDGTVQGWAAVAETSLTSSTLAVATDYVLSVSYSAKMTSTFTGSSYPATTISRLYKSFTTPNKDAIYAVINCRVSRAGGYDTGYLYILTVKISDTFLSRLGVVLTGADRIPKDKWVRIVVPLAKNTTAELRIALTHTHGEYGGTHSDDAYVWLDDFKLISK